MGRNERGTVVPLFALFMLAVVGVMLLSVRLGNEVITQSRAQTAADAVALAVASAGESAAVTVARANQANVISAERVGDRARVEVNVGGHRARASAGR